MQLIHGDCLEEMKKIPDKSIDMILCDLPYGTTACSWDVVIPFEPLWQQYRRIIKKGKTTVLFGSQPFTSLLIVSNLDWFKYEWIWEKHQGSCPMLACKSPLKSHENIAVFSEGFILYNPQMRKGKPYSGFDSNKYQSDVYGGGKSVHKENNGKRFPTSILRLSKIKNRLHPTQKPVPLLEYLIKTYTNEGDLILDNCMGSGSTGIACLNTNREFIGIELFPLPDKPISKTNPDYFNIAKNRIAKWKFEPTENSKEEQINLF